MRFGVHLPITDLGAQRFAVDHLVEDVETATGLGFEAVSANDHFVFGALAGQPHCAGSGGGVFRGRAALHHGGQPGGSWTGGAGEGPGRPGHHLGRSGGGGSRSRVVGSRTCECRRPVRRAMEALRRGCERRAGAVARRVVPRVVLRRRRAPRTSLAPARRSTPLGGSWGSTAGLRRAARLGDGWLASAYNITPDQFGERWARVQAMLVETGCLRVLAGRARQDRFVPRRRCAAHVRVAGGRRPRAAPPVRHRGHGPATGMTLTSRARSD